MTRRTFRSLYLAIPLVLASMSLAVAQDKTTDQTIDDILGDHTKYKTAITTLQRAVKGADAAAVAALVEYPIVVKVHGKDREIKSAKEFAQSYDAIMTPEITKAVVDQKYDDLFVNWQGIMFGDGQVWINGICRDNACKNFDAKVVTIQPGPR